MMGHVSVCKLSGYYLDTCLNKTYKRLDIVLPCYEATRLINALLYSIVQSNEHNVLYRSEIDICY